MNKTRHAYQARRKSAAVIRPIPFLTSCFFLHPRPRWRHFPETLSESAGGGYYIVEMQTKSDAQLLRDYAKHGEEAAFTEIVARHTNLVYSAALRQVDAPDIAAEVAQCVFIGLAQGARALSQRVAEDASLAGWLCRS